jgi:hypothetical protein
VLGARGVHVPRCLETRNNEIVIDRPHLVHRDLIKTCC